MLLYTTFQYRAMSGGHAKPIVSLRPQHLYHIAIASLMLAMLQEWQQFSDSWTHPSGPVRAPVGVMYSATCTMAIGIAGPEISAKPNKRKPNTIKNTKNSSRQIKNKTRGQPRTIHFRMCLCVCLFFLCNCLMSFLVLYICLIWLDRLAQLQSSAMPDRLNGKQQNQDKQENQ